MSLVASPHDPNILWTGSDDGLIHITQDGGSTWTNVTPKKMEEGIVNSIEVSPHNPAKAYAVLMRYKFMDLTSYIYKTEDYGRHWKLITKGIEGAHTFTRVVREDKKIAGLLYAGTETGVYISYDDGMQWDVFKSNLPIVPINDLYIQDNDLIAATAGRSFWILDDLSPLQEALNIKGLHIVKPKKAYRLFSGKTAKGSAQGTNPVSGIYLDYYLPKKVDSVMLKIEIFENDAVIRTYTSNKPKKFVSWSGGPSPEIILPNKEGHNRVHWDFRRASIPAVDKVFVYGSYAGSRVAPGNFKARLSYGEVQKETQITILPNPNIEATTADFDAQQKLLIKIDSSLSNIHSSVNQMRNVQTQLQFYIKTLKGNQTYAPLIEKAKAIEKKLVDWEINLIQPNQKTFQDVINFNNKLNAEWMYLKGFVDSEFPKVTKGSKDRFKDLLAKWKIHQKELTDLIEYEFSAFEMLFKSMEVPALLIPELTD